MLKQNRRHFLTGVAAAGAAGLIGAPTPVLAEPPPETATVRLPLYRGTSDCQAPEYISTELLRAEGFTDIQFVESGTTSESANWLAQGEIDFDWNFAPTYLHYIAAGAPIKVLAGMHTGCNELIAGSDIRSVAELKGKRVGIDDETGAPHKFLVVIAAHIGLDPFSDFQWVVDAKVSPLELLAQGKIDAFLNGAPVPQEARRRGIGHTILDMGIDRPWSKYFCCMLATTAGFAERNPVATKRVLRATLKAIDLCAAEPERVARLAVEGEFVRRYDDAIEALRALGYDTWRDYDPSDTLLFYALRMKETGLIKANPNQIITDGSDWRFLNELKQEMKT